MVWRSDVPFFSRFSPPCHLWRYVFIEAISTTTLFFSLIMNKCHQYTYNPDLIVIFSHFDINTKYFDVEYVLVHFIFYASTLFLSKLDEFWPKNSCWITFKLVQRRWWLRFDLVKRQLTKEINYGNFWKVRGSYEGSCEDIYVEETRQQSDVIGSCGAQVAFNPVHTKERKYVHYRQKHGMCMYKYNHEQKSKMTFVFVLHNTRIKMSGEFCVRLTHQCHRQRNSAGMP